MDANQTRRRVLRAGGLTVAGLLAGCGNDSSGNGDSGLFGGKETTDDDPELSESRPTTDQQTVETETEIEQIETSDCGHTYPLKPTSRAGEFRLMHGRRESGARLLQETRALFNQNDSHPEMNLHRGPSGTYLDQLRNSIPAGEGPHLFMWMHDIAGEFTENGMLSDQSDALRVDSCPFVDVAWQAANYDGQTVGLPFAVECPALIYNQDILEDLGVEPPETFTDWLSIMDEYHDPPSGKYGLAHPLDAYFSSWAAQAYGADIYNAQDDELGITSDELIEGLNIILDDLKPYMPSDPSEQAQMGVFTEENSPFLVNGPWTIAGLEQQGLNIGVTPIPAPGGAVSRPYAGVQMIYFADEMNNRDESARAAREFAEWYCTNAERILNLTNDVSYIPTLAGIDRDLLPETVRGFAEQFETGYLMPQNPKMTAVWAPYHTRLLDAYNSGNDPGPLMEDAAREIRNSSAWS